MGGFAGKLELLFTSTSSIYSTKSINHFLSGWKVSSKSTLTFHEQIRLLFQSGFNRILVVKEIIYSVGLLIGEEEGINPMMICIFNTWVSSLQSSHSFIFNVHFLYLHFVVTFVYVK